MIQIGSEICGKFESASSREWLATNGIGGYASASVSGANTRRYHGLLVAATRPPLGRVVMLSKFEEVLIIGGERFELSCNQYPGAVHPQGFRYLTGFRLDPFPIWTYNAGGLEVERSLFMVDGENSTVVRWRLCKQEADKNCSLEIKPLVAFRDHHHLLHREANFDEAYEAADGIVSLKPLENLPSLHLSHNAGSPLHQGHWYRDLEYPIERERGFDYREDLFQPFGLTFDLKNDGVVIASTERKDPADAAALKEAELARRTALIERAGVEGEFESQLVLAADQFIVSRGKGKTVIAGYHWFSDWGRDTMIALSGLTLATGRPEIAKSIITEFSKYISEGMLPNRFPDSGEVPEYNTVDATLWYFEAIRAYAQQTGDHEWVRAALYEKLVDIIEWHLRGTRYGIRVDTDGLLYAGAPGVQLTWMDAKIGDWVVTPRTGKAVEIQALWYNALCITADLADRFGDKQRRKKYTTMAAVAKSSFNGQFWNEDEECLFDVVDGDNKDGAVRPNQIFAVSLANTMLDVETARKVVDKVETELLTPVGLRSLSPKDPGYVPIYIGSPFDRDAGYHQGTVWAWLIGPYVDAYRRVHASADAETHVQKLLEGFRSHLAESMVGQISEIFDADPPHFPRGCGAQAWSVAELLRITSQAKSRRSPEDGPGPERI